MKRLFLFGLTIAAVGCAARPVAAPETGRALTFANVRSYFSDTLKFRPTEVQERCVIFYEGEWVSPQVYNYCVIILENSDEDLQLTFYLTDDREMNWVTEFLDSPFFTRHETEIFSASCTVKNMRAGSGSAGSGSTSAIGNRNTRRSS